VVKTLSPAPPSSSESSGFNRLCSTSAQTPVCQGHIEKPAHARSALRNGSFRAHAFSTDQRIAARHLQVASQHFTNNPEHRHTLLDREAKREGIRPSHHAQLQADVRQQAGTTTQRILGPRDQHSAHTTGAPGQRGESTARPALVPRTENLELRSWSEQAEVSKMCSREEKAQLLCAAQKS